MRKFLIFLFITSAAFAQNQEIFTEAKSQLNIPYQYFNYLKFEKDIHKSTNIHTAVKPFVYQQIDKEVKSDSLLGQFITTKKSFIGKKIWQEHLVNYHGDDFWVHANLLGDYNVGKEILQNTNTLQNSRLFKIDGQIGKKFSFSTIVSENQTLFPKYITDFIKINQPEDGNGLIPGQTKSKGFGPTGFDYGVSTGYVNYQPSKYFTFQFGHDRNFIGDGYRSMFLSDVSAPYTYGKITTNIGKVQYTNLWTWLRDFNFSIDDPLSGNNNAHKRKYGSFHYISMNLTSKLNIGFFEGIISDNSGTSGTYNAEFLNPFMFYKNSEFANGEDAGSGVVGISTKLKFYKSNYLYTQFLLDDFKAKEFFKNDGYWANKNAIQIGVKGFDIFGIKNLHTVLEYNRVTPFTYAHEKQHNYAHYGQPLAHLWGGNFWESIFIAQYANQRWTVNGKLIYGKKGFDFEGNPSSFGGNIFVNSTARTSDYNQTILQGNVGTVLNLNVELSYLLNPLNNLKVYSAYTFRNFKADDLITRIGIVPESSGYTFNTTNTQWFVVGVKADLFNNYHDF